MLQWALADYVLAKGGIVYIDDVLYDLKPSEKDEVLAATDELIGDGVLRSPAPHVYMPADAALDAVDLAQLVFSQIECVED